LGTGAPIAAAALVALEVELVVVGGCALVLRDVEAVCGDLDVVPMPDAANLRTLCRALDVLGVRRPSARVIGRRPITSVASPYGRIDLMIETARREYEDLASHASERDVYGVRVPVASIADVLRLRERFAHE
jgi:hypothetical protein